MRKVITPTLGAGAWNPSPWKSGTLLFDIANTKAADGLATQGA